MDKQVGHKTFIPVSLDYLPVLPIVVVFLLLSTRPAMAYIDAGSGGMLIQLVVAGGVGFGIWLRLCWRRFRSFFSRSKKPRDSDPC